MPLIRSYSSLFVILSICFSIQCVNCQSMSHFSDNFDYGIDPAIWRTEGMWAPDNGDNSVRSDIICRGNASILLDRTLIGPCKITFSWKISRGHDNFTLYDNDRETLYKLPNYICDSRGHASIDWTNVTFNLSDNEMHNLKWVHKNPYDRGTVWLDSIQIDYITPPIFENFSVTPVESIYLSDSAGDVISNSKISSKFNYSVESSADNLSLMISPPNSSIQLGPFLPRSINKISQNMNKFEWNNIQLDCTDVGDGAYWFKADGYLSPKRAGPHLTTLIYETTSEMHDVDNINLSHWTRYGISIKSLKNWGISIKVLDGSQLDDTKTYSAGSGLQNIVWDYQWNDSLPIPPLNFSLD